MKPRILFVDDEFNVLAALKRQLHSYCEVELARNGEDALERLKSAQRYAAIVSDLRMPGMDGHRLLCQARTIAPDSVRLILTGHIEGRSAVAAVNEAGVFRILMKPCESALLVKALGEAVDYHLSMVQQRETAEQTNLGAVALLTDLLGLVSPFAMERGERLRGYAQQVVRALHLDEPWLLETAALLSQVGCVVLGPHVLEKAAAGKTLTAEEQIQVDASPDTGARLLSHIPRLARVGAMVAGQRVLGNRAGAVDDVITIGTRLLRLVCVYDSLIASGISTREVIDRLRMDPVSYPAQMVTALEAFEAPVSGTAWVLGARELKPGMVFEEDIRARDGVLVASRGQEASAPLIERILEFTRGQRLAEPFRVRVPAEFNQVFGNYRPQFQGASS